MAKRYLHSIIALSCSALLTFTTGSQAASLAPVMANNGMVVSAHELASQVGIDVLKAGGNAVDAAIAVGYALAVVYPSAGNIGGGGFMTISLADGRKTVIDFRETAPAAATETMYLDAQGNPVPGLSAHGYLAVATPGTVHGLEYARAHYGTLPRAKLIDPAIALANQGFLLNYGDILMIEPSAEYLAKDPAASSIFLKDGQLPPVGYRLVQRDLAKTLTAIRDEGAPGFYSGWVAKAIAASSKKHGGLISEADLNGYQSKERPPLQCHYHDETIITVPPPSSGGIALCEMFNILEGYPLRDWGFNSAKSVHAEVEAMRRTYFDRNHKLGDPAFINNPTEHLIDKKYAAEVRHDIKPDQAGSSKDMQGEPSHEGQNTTHYSIVDHWNNAVSVTYTLNDWYGAKVVAEGTGIVLNDEMDDFAAKPGATNLYGLEQSKANAIAPGKRPLSSMAPTIINDQHDKPMLVIGTPGGSRIPTTILQTTLNFLDFGMDIQEATDAPRIHNQWMPDLIYMEDWALSTDTQNILMQEGYQLKGMVGQNNPMIHALNHIAAIAVNSPYANGAPIMSYHLFGANDPRRRTGAALGY